MTEDRAGNFRNIARNFVYSDGHPIVSRMPVAVAMELVGALLRSFLLLIKSDIGLLNATSAASVLHRNGFTKIPLFEDPTTGREIRFHSWGSAQTGDENIHNHTKPYWSFVFSGAVIVEEFQLGPGSYYNGYKSSHIGNSDYTLQSLGRLSLERTDTRIIKPGECHSGDISTLHRLSIPEGRTAATIFCQGSRAVRETRIFSGSVLKEAREEHFALSKNEVLGALEHGIEECAIREVGG